MKLKSNSTLNDAIIAAGGTTRYANKKVSLFRLLENGKDYEKVYNYDFMESFNSSKNPRLRKIKTLSLSSQIPLQKLKEHFQMSRDL